MLIVAVQVQRQIKPSRGGRKHACGNIVFQQPDALLLVAARDAHEEAKKLGDRAESVDVIIVEA